MIYQYIELNSVLERHASPMPPPSGRPRSCGNNNRIVRSNCQLYALTLFAAMCCAFGFSNATADSPDLSGRWQLDVKASDNAEKSLKGIRISKRKHRTTAKFQRPSGPGSETQQRYWEQANAGEQWRHSRELAHAGPMQRLLESENLEILADDTGYWIIYADGYERQVIPNPAGRVFTASGEELVKTDIGHTLAYWKKDTLTLETRIKAGGKLTERLSISRGGKTLKLNVKIDRRDWEWVAELKRVYHRVPLAKPPIGTL